MAFRHAEVPSLGPSLSNIMLYPSSAAASMHAAGLDKYRRLGGNCIHLHGEGGETHSRAATGGWLRDRGLRREFFLCTQVSHDGWDEVAQRPLCRFTPQAITEDVATDLELLQTNYLDFIYLDDHAEQPFEPVLEAIWRLIEKGHLLAWGFRNWSADRMEAANAYALHLGALGAAAVVTTELSLAVANTPLWPEYRRFDQRLKRVVDQLGLAVFAHASDLTLGQCLFGDEVASARLRPQWVHRWDKTTNALLVQEVQSFASERGLTPREVSTAWVLNQKFPTVGIVDLSALLNEQCEQYERASQLHLSESELNRLTACSTHQPNVG